MVALTIGEDILRVKISSYDRLDQVEGFRKITGCLRLVEISC
jgi:hypothetical protein